MQQNYSVLHNISLENYLKLVNSGMFWEWFPELTGIYKQDMELIKK